MATQVKDILLQVRDQLVEPTARFWSDDELIRILSKGVKDLWRDIVDLKQEHYLVRNTTDVSYPAHTDQLIGLPENVHKLYLIEALDLSTNGGNSGLYFRPKELNAEGFQAARSQDAVDPSNNTIYYEVTSQGGPVGAPVIYCAPKVTSAVPIAFSYVPTLEPMTTPDAIIPIPGEADNALVAWTIAYARAKERDDRAPDPAWLGIYGTDKQHLLQSLGLREYQEPTYVDAMFEQYWG